MAARPMDWNFDHLNTWIAHVVSGLAIVSTLAGLLPPVAALVAIVWYAIQIAESKSVMDYFRRRRERKRAKLQKKLDALHEIDRGTPPDAA